MGFFESVAHAPDPEPARPPTPPWAKPDDVLPGSAGIELLLAHNDEAAVAISELRAYPAGFSFMVSVVLRQDDGSDVLGDLTRRMHSRHGSGELPAEFLRLGIEFADGAVASNIGGRIPVSDQATPEAPLLMPDSGGGGDRRYDMNYWVWPLPPDGPVTFVCAWPVVGIGESSATVDAAVIHAAAARAVMLWPEDLAP